MLLNMIFQNFILSLLCQTLRNYEILDIIGGALFGTIKKKRKKKRGLKGQNKIIGFMFLDFPLKKGKIEPSEM